MIRRISKANDLLDYIKSCPSGVIDDIYKIEYYIQGYNVYIDANFNKVGNHLEVILPTKDLQTLPNGILMRKAYYKVIDSSYPDGYYNLEFEDNMNIWLGENESETPPSAEYVTEEEFSATLSSYALQEWVSSKQFATESWVSSQGYLSSIPASYATKSWVSGQGYLKSVPSGYATETWVSDQGYLTSIPSHYATKSWVSDQGYLTSETIPSDIATQSWVSSKNFATESWVSAQGYITSTGVSGLATMSWVEEQGYITSTGVSGLATMSWVEEQGYLTSTGVSGLATMSWVEEQGYITSTGVSGLATMSWVEDQGYLTSVPSHYATESWVSAQGYLTSVPSGYATESWVSDQGYLTSVPSHYATKSWVSDQGYLTSETLPSDLATESWVASQGYITSSALSGYATESWVLSQNYITSQPLSDYVLKSYESGDVRMIIRQSNPYIYLTTSTESQLCIWPSMISLIGDSRYTQIRQGIVAITNGYGNAAAVRMDDTKSEAVLLVNDGDDTIEIGCHNIYTYYSSVSTTIPISNIATQSWATSEFFEESKVWTGTQSQWNQLTSDQQALYTIALVTE